MFDWQKENRRIVTCFDKLATRFAAMVSLARAKRIVAGRSAVPGLLANYFSTLGADFLDHVIDPVEQYIMVVYLHPLLVFNRLGQS